MWHCLTSKNASSPGTVKELWLCFQPRGVRSHKQGFLQMALRSCHIQGSITTTMPDSLCFTIAPW